MFRWLKRTRKYPHLGCYPACDHLNVALRVLLKKPEENRIAIEEICYAIEKAGGYLYDSVAEELELFDGAKMDVEERQCVKFFSVVNGLIMANGWKVAII